MEKLLLVSVSTENLVPVKRSFDFPVAMLTPQISEKDVKGVKTSKVSSGSLCLNPEAVKALNVSAGSKVTISESTTGLFIYDSTSLAIDERSKKKLTKTGVLKLSQKNYLKILSDGGKNVEDAWYFKMVECIVDLPGADNVKVYMFEPFEKRA